MTNGVNQAMTALHRPARDDICIGRFVCLKDMALSAAEAIKLICAHSTAACSSISEL